jgi:alpha-mannosidase
LNTSKAICDIQFGNVERNTHTNTPWDKARYEFCAHKYVDICEGNYGVALMNDCKYGYAVDKNELSLTILKSATYPDFTADKGKHIFAYSIYAHDGYADREEVVWQSYLLNNPLQCETSKKVESGLPETYSLLSCEQKNIIVETVKKSEDGNATVVRLFECMNKQTEITLELGFEFSSVYLSNLLEKEEKELPFDGNKVTFTVKPFEIVTLLFKK